MQIGGAKGDMSKADTAPNDPIFWLHHSNIDRIWCEWQELLPQLSMSYDGKDEKGRAVTTDDLIDLGPLQHFLPSSYWHNRPIRVKDALDYKKWCYSYTRSVVFSWSDQTWIPNTGKTKLEMGCKDQSTLMSKKAAASSFFVNQ